MPPETTAPKSPTRQRTTRPAPEVIGRVSEVEALQQRVDELAQQVLQARDAAIGAEAELGVARARVGELEHQVHVRDVEIDELRRAIDSGHRVPDVTEALAAGDRLARGLARRARRPRT